MCSLQLSRVQSASADNSAVLHYEELWSKSKAVVYHDFLSSLFFYFFVFLFSHEKQLQVCLEQQKWSFWQTLKEKIILISVDYWKKSPLNSLENWKIMLSDSLCRLFCSLATFLFSLNHVWPSDSVQCCVISSHPLAQLQHHQPVRLRYLVTHQILRVTLLQWWNRLLPFIEILKPPRFESLSLNRSRATLVAAIWADKRE